MPSESVLAVFHARKLTTLDSGYPCNRTNITAEVNLVQHFSVVIGLLYLSKFASDTKFTDTEAAPFVSIEDGMRTEVT